MYIDLLIKIKNAQKARKESIKLPYSNMDLAVAEILAKGKFIGAVEKKGRMPKRILEVTLRYDAN
ncbi:MAG: 30S ribosomal protein S8, partial [Patescibacteria group bacterium]